MASIDSPWIRRTVLVTAFAIGATVCAQSAEEKEEGWRKSGEAAAGDYVVEPGSRIPLSLINSVSTKHSAEGDRVYLQTTFPLLVNGKIVIPTGHSDAGKVKKVKRTGR